MALQCTQIKSIDGLSFKGELNVVVRMGIKVNVVVNCHGYQTGLASRM